MRGSSAVLTRGDRVFLDVANVAVLVAFAIDYFVELALARERVRYVRREWASLLIVLAQAAALVPSLTAFGGLRILLAGDIAPIRDTPGGLTGKRGDDRRHRGDAQTDEQRCPDATGVPKPALSSTNSAKNQPIAIATTSRSPVAASRRERSVGDCAGRLLKSV